MKQIRVLDCTLRDGGYCNNWTFGKSNIHKIVNGLLEANLDIIECGYISQKKEFNIERTQYTSFEQVSQFIPQNREGKIFVGMINYGEFSIENVPEYDGVSVEGIRVTFHKKERFDALEFCSKLKDKGYKVFIQGMVSLSYTDEEFLDLINRVNAFGPYAFYIVDSFGMMKEKDLKRLFYVVEHRLSENIYIGFHSHNNMQLAYSNCLAFAGMETNRPIIIDASIYGMGRGAGNLNTELFIQYLNENQNGNYKLKPLLTIIDEILDDFHKENCWGYNLPNYISAKNNAHPNYASFLADKNTLTVEDMENIFLLMNDEKKIKYDKEYIEELYIRYLATGKVQEEHKGELIENLKGKRVVLVAPGKSSEEEKDKIEKAVKDAICISVNFDYFCSDYIFLSNLRRFRELDADKYSKCIVTSNITSDKVYLQTKYRELLNDIETVRDNAGLMAIKFLKEYGVKEIMLAGFDGYSHDARENFASKNIEYITKNALLDAMNAGISEALKQYSKEIKLSFITKTKYLTL